MIFKILKKSCSVSVVSQVRGSMGLYFMLKTSDFQKLKSASRRTPNRGRLVNLPGFQPKPYHNERGV